MKKIIGIFTCAVLILSVFAFIDILNDKQVLKNSVIRLHVVANSDSPEDQEIKLKVKDAVVAYLQPRMQTIASRNDAIAYIQEQLAALQTLANQVLDNLGVTDRTTVKFQQEAFPVRHYDTFYLPSGIYDALRIEIGEAKGKNWWCVVFPSLCLPATTKDFQDTAVSSGFSPSLSNTLSGNKAYKFRFFLLDWFGKIENLF